MNDLFISHGIHQSPIDIKTNISVYDQVLNSNRLIIDYSNLCCCHIENNGVSFQMTSCNGTSGNKNKAKLVVYFFSKLDLFLEVTGGPTSTNYKFLQFHMHWGPGNSGSEHTIDGKQYAAEIHFVNIKTKFQTFKEALDSYENDALLVLGVLVEVTLMSCRLD